MKYFTVDILTPSKIIAKGIPAESLLIPTVRGQINVLEGHTHIVSKLASGVLSVFGGADYADRHFALSSGVCKILENQIVILANTAEENTDVDVERAKLALKNAEDHLKNTDGLSHEDVEKYQQKAELAKIRIQIGEFTRPR
ncbi:MAG: ATP synthase F1 subunit epsilon [Bacteriovorax sp.]|nr:ATP synthase F1 subunit epsilon [Bacteriovorax sp.]